MSEVYTKLPNMLRYYGKVENGKITKYGTQVPFNFEFILKLGFGSKASDYKTVIESWLNGMPKGTGIRANWVVSF